MKERVRHILEAAAIAAGISGLTLSELRRTEPYIFSIVFIVLIVLCFSVLFLSWKQVNRFTNKPVIDSIWQRLLVRATHSIRIFAGDASWVRRDEDVIRQCVDNGVNVSVLCRRPGTNKTLKDNISRAIAAGAEVWYYDPKDNPVVRGLVIDEKEQGVNTALTVQKAAKINIERRYGVPGTADIYRYEAVRYIPPQDTHYIEMMCQLFDFISEKALTGIVLHQAGLDLSKMIDLLQVVPHYSNIESLEFKIETVQIQQLWSSCIYVKEYKSQVMRAILDAYETQDFRCFETCLCLSHVKKCLLLPPILERHEDKLVAIDGVHRLYYRYIYKQQSEADCLIIDGAGPLPGEPVPFVNLKVTPRKLPREQNFVKFNPDLFRNIESLDNALVQFGKNIPG